MQDRDYRTVLDDFDPYIDELERAELGESKVLIKNELYMPVHISRDWIKCFVTSTQQDGFRMYLEGGRRFLLSAKSFDVGKYYISPYEGFPNMDIKPKCGYIAKVERQRDSSFTVGLEYCHLCDQKLGYFCCGRSTAEREVIARVSHHVKRYRKVDMDFRMITVTIPTISKSGRRKVWCPRSFRKVNPSLPNSADVLESLSCTPKMGMRLVSKLPEWNEEANNLVVKFQGTGRILVASAKNFLLYEEKKSGPDLAELSMSHIQESPAISISKKTLDNGNANGSIGQSSEVDDVDLEGGHSDSHASPAKSAAAAQSPQMSSLTNQNMKILKKASRSTSSTNLGDNDSAAAGGDEASRSSKNSKGSKSSSRSRREPRVVSPTATGDSSSPKVHRTRSQDSDAGSVQGASNGKMKTSSTTRVRSREGGSVDGSTSPKGSPRAASTSSTTRTKKSPREKSPRELSIEDTGVLQFGKTTSTRFTLDFKYPLSPLQAFGIAISTFASDEVNDANHEINHMNSPVIMSRKQMDYSRARGASMGNYQPPIVYSPLKSPFLPSK